MPVAALAENCGCHAQWRRNGVEKFHRGVDMCTPWWTCPPRGAHVHAILSEDVPGIDADPVSFFFSGGVEEGVGVGQV